MQSRLRNGVFCKDSLLDVFPHVPWLWYDRPSLVLLTQQAKVPRFHLSPWRISISRNSIHLSLGQAHHCKQSPIHMWNLYKKRTLFSIPVPWFSCHCYSELPMSKACLQSLVWTATDTYNESLYNLLYNMYRYNSPYPDRTISYRIAHQQICFLIKNQTNHSWRKYIYRLYVTGRTIWYLLFIKHYLL